MKEETRRKLAILRNKAGRAGKAALEFLIPAAIGATIGAAWYGWFGAIKNEVAIDEIKKTLDNHGDVISNNAHCQQYDRNRLNELTRQQNLLMEKALQITAGEEPAKENKEEAA